MVKKELRRTMALARFFYKHRRSILAALLWCFAILSFLQWQQRKLKRKWKHQKLAREMDYGSGESDIDAGLDILLSNDRERKKEITMEKPIVRHKSQGLECSITEGIDWNIKIKPKYVTRPDRFLIPVFCYGPNNQLHGFRESIFMAIKLNRTIITPPFFKHTRNDVTANDEAEHVVDTFLRLDVKLLRKLVSTLPSSMARKVCKAKFDALFTTRAAYCSNTKLSRLTAVCKHLNMDCTQHGKFIIEGSPHGKKYCPEPLVPIYPSWETIPKTGTGQPFSFIDDLSKINEFYDSEHVCPILGFPYRAISFHKTLEGPRHQQKISALDREIMRDIVAQTPRPAHVRNSVTEFLHKFSSAKYVAMHWRYNDDDWAMHCEHDHGNQKTCNKIIEIMHDATKMGSAFVAYLRKLPNINIMYIAAPPDEMDMLNRVKLEIMKKLPTVQIYLSTQLLPFLDEYFEGQGCANYEENRFEILSLAEMEICSRSEIFLRSAGSSWSMNINLERVIEDRNLRDLQNTQLLEDE